MHPDDQEKEYKRLMGEAALARQQALAKELYPCCANKREDGHHPLCRVQRARLNK